MYACKDCERTFETEHGRNVHYGHEHGEVPPELKQDDPPTTPEFTKEHRQKISESQQGENNTMYGRAMEDHPRWTDPEYKRTRTKEVLETRKEVYERDDYTCQVCGDRSVDPLHPIHHLDHDETNNVKENMEVRCRSCHSAYHASGGEK